MPYYNIRMEQPPCGHNLRRAEQRSSRLQKNLFSRRKKNSGKQQKKKHKSHHTQISRNESFFV